MAVNKSYLPEKETEEFNKLASFYQTCSDSEINRLAKEYGYKNRDAFVDTMRRRRGVLRIAKAPEVELETTASLSELENSVLSIVRKEAVTVGEISRRVDRSAETIIKTIDSLRDKNYEVKLDEISRQVTVSREPGREFEPTEFKYFRHFYRIGLVSDSQICSKYQQMTLLYDAYKDFDDRQVDFVLHAGDLDDGENMYRGHINELFKHGVDEHREYIIENFPSPQKKKYKTYVIGGQHDFCWFKQNGYNILSAICEKRKDLVYRGFFDARFDIKGLGIELHHPGGGVAYARSYKLQKYIENLIGFVTSIPSANAPVLLVSGHVHIPVHLPLYMGIDAVSLPCHQSQTPYLAEKGLMPVVGYAIAEIYLDKDNNLTSTKVEFVNQNAQIKKADY